MPMKTKTIVVVGTEVRVEVAAGKVRQHRVGGAWGTYWPIYDCLTGQVVAYARTRALARDAAATRAEELLDQAAVREEYDPILIGWERDESPVDDRADADL